MTHKSTVVQTWTSLCQSRVSSGAGGASGKIGKPAPISAAGALHPDGGGGAIEAVGIQQTTEQAVEAIHRGGTAEMIGVAPTSTRISVEATMLLQERIARGVDPDDGDPEWSQSLLDAGGVVVEAGQGIRHEVDDLRAAKQVVQDAERELERPVAVDRRATEDGGRRPCCWSGRRGPRVRSRPLATRSGRSGIGHSPMPGNSAYNAAKAGAWMLTRCLAQEVWKQGIEVNDVVLRASLDALDRGPVPGRLAAAVRPERAGEGAGGGC